jgi:galactose mutarotase-like enzyme
MMKVSEECSQKENVLICNGDCRVTFVPQLGGKIASIRIKDMEVLQPPLAPLGVRTHTMPFDDSDASGWDECVPSVAACVVEVGGARIEVPDHGDVWRVPWEIVAESVNSLTLRSSCFSLPLEMVRKSELARTARGWRLQLDYTMTNRGDATVPWSWCAHPLFDVAPGDQIELPLSVNHLRLEGSGGGRLGNGNATVQWPMAQLADGSTSDLRLVQPAASGIGDKLFAGPLSPSEGWCTLHRPSAGLRIRMSFDVTKTPYLGLWLCYGGWPDRSGPKQNCVALEPATAPVDSLAQTGPWSRTLAPGSFCSWTMAVEFELVES